MARTPSRVARALLLPLLLLAPLAAQADTPRTLRWDELLAQLDAQPELAAAAAAREAATGALRATALPNPELELSRGRAESLAGDEVADTWGVALSLPLRPWGPWRHQRAAARAEREAAEHALAGMRRETLRQLSAAFWQVAHDQREARLLAERESQLARLVEIAGLRVALGEARPGEPLRLEIEAAALAAESRAAAAAATLAREALGRRLGLTPPGDYSVEADWDSLPPLPASVVGTGAAATAAPALAAADARSAAATAALAAARAERWPGLSLSAFCERELDAETEGLALALELPLFDRRGAGVARARAEAAAARHERAIVVRDLVDALAAATAAARLARERALDLREAVLPRAAQVLAAAEAEYRVGEAGLVDLIDARRAHADTESELLAAQLDYRLALAALAALTPGDDHD